jgi:hypothetical protein
MMKKSNQQAPIQDTNTHSASLSDEERKELRKEFFEQRNLFVDLQQKSSQSFDGMIATLSGGALGLSLTFIRQIVPVAMPGTIVFLALAWLFLTLSLLAILLSHFTSQLGMMKACTELEQAYLGSTPQAQQPHPHFLKRAHARVEGRLFDFFGHRKTTHFLNIAAIIFCVAGIGLLMWFVVLNMPQLQVPLQK